MWPTLPSRPCLPPSPSSPYPTSPGVWIQQWQRIWGGGGGGGGGGGYMSICNLLGTIGIPSQDSQLPIVPILDEQPLLYGTSLRICQHYTVCLLAKTSLLCNRLHSYYELHQLISSPAAPPPPLPCPARCLFPCAGIRREGGGGYHTYFLNRLF